MGLKPVPGANTVLVMGILSIVGTLFCCGPFGAIFSIIGLMQAKTSSRVYREDPEGYSDYSLVNTGRVLAYIGLALSLIILVLLIIYFGFIMALITAGSGNEWGSGF